MRGFLPYRLSLPVYTLLLCATTVTAALAQNAEVVTQQTFSDVSPEHPSHTAVEFLAANGVIRGYDDGTFRPDNPINRAEALKLIMAPRMTQAELIAATQTGSIFADVDQSAWYHPFASAARARGVIDGPPEKEEFLGGNQVILTEFLKILQLAFGVNPISDFNDIDLPLARDASDPDAWYYPYLRYALASSSVTALGDGALKPGQPLTRSDAAELVFSLIAYKEGFRTPVLLKIAEREVQNVLSHLSREDGVSEARFASARAIIASRGAIAVSDDAKAKGIVKISEAFAAIVDCVEAGNDGRPGDAEAAAKTAWALAGRARAFSEELDLSASLAQKIATNLAGQARAMMEKSP